MNDRRYLLQVGSGQRLPRMPNELSDRDNHVGA